MYTEVIRRREGLPLLERLGRISPNRQRVLLIVGCLLLFGCWWKSLPLTELDEAVYGEVGREMVESGNYLVPHFNYAPYYEKPPLAYWLEAGSLRLFGVNETALRLPSALCALALVLLLHAFLGYWLPRRAAAGGAHLSPSPPVSAVAPTERRPPEPRVQYQPYISAVAPTERRPPDARTQEQLLAQARGAAFLGGIAMAIMPMVAIWSRACTLDAVTTLFTTGALLAFLQADLVGKSAGDTEPSAAIRQWYRVGAFSAGLAFLAKGPIGLLLPGMIWLIYHLLERDVRAEWRRVPWLSALALFLLAAAPWYVLITRTDGPAFLQTFFLQENFGRYALIAREHHGFGASLVARLLNLPIFPLLSLILLFPCSAWLLRDLRVPLAGSRRLTGDPILPRLRRYAWCWIAAIVVFFALSLTQNVNYIHAISGGAGILFALYGWGRMSDEASRPRRAETVALSLIALVYTALPLYALLVQRAREAALGPAPLPQPLTGVVVLAALSAGLLYQAGLWWTARRPTPAPQLVWAMSLWLAVYLALFAGGLLYTESGYAHNAEIGAFLRGQPRGLRVLMYHNRHPESLPFQARREIEYYREPSRARYVPFHMNQWKRTLSFGQEIARAAHLRESVFVITDTRGLRELRGMAPVTVRWQRDGLYVTQTAWR